MTKNILKVKRAWASLNLNRYYAKAKILLISNLIVFKVSDKLNPTQVHKLKDMELTGKALDNLIKIVVLFKSQAFKKNFMHL